MIGSPEYVAFAAPEVCRLIFSLTWKWTFAAPDTSAFSSFIGKSSRFAFEAPDTSILQCMVLPLRERFDAPLMSKVDSGLVICPLRFEAPLSSMSSFSFARKSPPTSILLAPERSTFSLAVVKSPIVSNLQTPVNSTLSRLVTVTSAVKWSSSWFLLFLVVIFPSI